MKTNKLLILIIVIIIGGGILIALKNKNNTNIIPEVNKTVSETEIMVDEKMGDEMASANYLDYDINKFADNNGKKRILYFHADWCPTCRPLNIEFQQRGDELPKDVVVFKVNYDKETQLKTKYAIPYQHTFVQVDENEDALKKWSGGTFDEVLENII